MKLFSSHARQAIATLLFLGFLTGLETLHGISMIFSFQGKVLVNKRVYDGVGKFGFAIVDGENPNSILWAHDDIEANLDRPYINLPLEVKRGFYQLRLGDPVVMKPFPPGLLESDRLLVRVWFDDGVNGVELLSPDAPITSVVFAMKAGVAETVERIPEGAIENRHLDASLASDIAWLKQRIVLQEQSGVLVSSNPSDPAFLQSGMSVFSVTEPEMAVRKKDLPNAPSPRILAGSSHSLDHWFIWGGKTSTGLAMNGGSVYRRTPRTWSPIAGLDQPEARWEHVQLVVDGKMFIHGGRASSRSSGLLATTGLYDPDRSRWSSLSAASNWEPRSKHAGIVLPASTSVLLFGGRTALGYSNEFALLDVDTDQLNSVATQHLEGLLSPREQAQMVLAGHHVVLWGGLNQGGALGDGLRLDLDNGLASSPISAGISGRYGFSMTSTGEKIIVWGGTNTQGDELSDGGIFDPSNNTWSEIPSDPLVAARHGHAAIWNGRELLIAGGMRGQQTVGDVCAFDPLRGTWRKINTDISIPAAGSFLLEGTTLTSANGVLADGLHESAISVIDTSPIYYLYKKP